MVPRALRLAVTAILLAAGAAQPSALRAHPHIWIDATATFRFAGDKLAGLGIEWAFDELFSNAVRADFDPHKTGRFDEKAQAKMKSDMAGLKDFNYYIFLRIGGQLVKVVDVTDFSAAVKGSAVLYRFTIPLESPVDPATTPVSVSLYDESFYVDVALDKNDPVRFEGGGQPACRFEIRDDKEHPIYFGLVFPKRIDLKCKKA